MNGKLENDTALQALLDVALTSEINKKGAKNWHARLASFLATVKAAIPSKLQDIDFLKQLWDDNPVSATGMGSVKMAPALENADFRAWFTTEVSNPLPPNDSAAELQLTTLYNDLCDRLKALCGRTPTLKINRVLCSIYPEHFTTISDRGKLRELYIEMGGSKHDHPVRKHKAIRARIDAILDTVPSDPPIDLAQRICIPWLLYKHMASNDAGDTTEISDEGVTVLSPLPATLRRKGLTALKGGFQTLLSYLPELNEGVSKEEFADIIRQSNPELAPSSLMTCINVVSREFDLCKRTGDTYILSARGANLLDSQDPDELADHLLTKVLGVDHIIKALAHSSQSKSNLITLLQQVNPGWTTDFAPSALLSWLISLNTIEVTDKKLLALTERGGRWEELISWAPQGLPKPVETVETVSVDTIDELHIPAFPILWSRISDHVEGKLTFEESLVAQLHAGIWFHPIRHFAILTGISGSGKTQLAQHYASALCEPSQAPHDHVRIIPVQPGWYDPSPLLGYVNPIQDSSYRSAPFLELLLRAASDPGHPYTAILDEMNLSHPEQYLAPILSAMETHGWIDLHQLSEDSTLVPRRVRYPSNLAIIGTLNMDETTHGLSDKVLDRAYTLEFWNIEVQAFPGWASTTLAPALKEKTQRVLIELVNALSPVRLHFGWRTINDIISYLEFHGSFAPQDDNALDNVVYAKVLPKLRGDTSATFQHALENTIRVLSENNLDRCLKKVISLKEDLALTGSARFWR
ncbi:restriction endonuclease [Bordetella petrii]|nr:restriction endonuclease [Bordetella petrii]